MHILIVATNAATVNEVLTGHLKLLKQQGHLLELACQLDEPLRPDILACLSAVHPIDFPDTLWTWHSCRAVSQLNHLLKQNRYALVHVHQFVAAMLTRQANLKPQQRLLYTPHGLRFYAGAPLKNWLVAYPLERRAAKHTDGIIALNSEDYRRCQQFAPPQMSIYRTHGLGVRFQNFDPSPFPDSRTMARRKLGISPKEIVLISNTELTHSKNQATLLRAMAQLIHAQYLPLKLILLGTGPAAPEYHHLVEKLELEEHVLFLGDRKNRDEYLQLADLAVFPSIRAGLSLRLTEAIAAGVPVIASNIRGHQELVKHGVNGWLFNDFTELVTLLQQAVNQHFSVDRQVNRQIIRQYDQAHVLRELTQIYQDFTGTD